ncbi:glutathione S-transferase family protein [Marinobacterium lutimaris]|uniref:Glutathione S-transferase n=1 Tax=Marinobacterium lutimaris TaxID=568106 RepID=A0A1H6BZ98_9GAMM|nr:glutathione S-transferase family protein [Marinobacterium lutimaris]SEG65765.1 glutathione S-transferase [Marinobacterium lutimaris]
MNPDKLVLHHCLGSRSTRVLWLLNEIEADFEVVEHDFPRGLRDPEFRAVSPLGRVPVLVDGDQVLCESGAIIQYLCETRQRWDLMPQMGEALKPAWLQWLHFAETLATLPAALFQNEVSIPEAERSQAMLELDRRRLGKALNYLDEQLKGRSYLLGESFSAADIAVGYSVFFSTRFASLEDYPDLAEWYLRLSQRPAFRQSFPAEVPD